MRILVLLVLLTSPCLSVVALSEEVTLQEVMDAGLPVMTVTTVDGVEPTFEVAFPPEGCIGLGIKNATKVPARMTISLNGAVLYDSGEYVDDVSGITVKVRGNTSALNAKRPYKLKLQKKADLLCRGDDKFKDKNWALIRDEKLLTMAGLKANELLGLQWTPAYEYVNLVFNGEYRGVYMLIETVERNVKCRLDVDETGYIFEYDPYWWNEDKHVSTKLYYSVQYTYKYPDCDKVSDEQQAYLQELVYRFEASLKNGTYTDCIDVRSFASWMLCHDLLGCEDGVGSNMFLTKYDNTEATKIAMANLWDFDSALSPSISTEWDAVHNRWFFEKLFNSANKSFVRTYVKRWEELKPTLFSQLQSFFSDFAGSAACSALETSLSLDEKRWDREDQPSVSSQIDNIQQWFSSRKAWLEEHISPLKDYDQLGDVDENAVIDERDFDAIVSHIMGYTPDAFNESAADLNCDGKVNAADVVLFINELRK